MGVIKSIKIFYIGLTVFLVLGVNAVTLTFSDVFPAVVLMWINYFIFHLGYNSSKTKDIKEINLHANEYHNVLFRHKFIVVLATVVCSIAAVYFYTGQTPYSIIVNILNGNSLYKLYLDYFKINQIATFSIRKLPYILMLFEVKLVMIYSYLSLLIRKEGNTISEKLFLFIITLSFLYVGIARGTNYEFFEYSMLVIFIIYARTINRVSRKITPKTYIVIGAITVLALIVFSVVVSQRGTSYYVSNEIRYDSNKFFSKLFPSFSLFITSLFGYFGFGFFYVTTFINKVWLGSAGVLFGAFLPLGFKLNGIGDLGEKINTIIDPSVCWTPDIVGVINVVGLFGLFFICFMLGYLLKRIDKQGNTNNDNLFKMTSFMIMLQMMSLPIGNFIMVSSANRLLVILIILLWLKRFFFKRKKYKKLTQTI